MELRKIIVSIVSDQTIPNVLFLKENGGAEKYIFISTEKMESPLKNTTRSIIDSAGLLAGKCEKIIVQEDSLSEIEEKLMRNIPHEDGDFYLVNITGGNKIMSLGVYNFFSRKGDAEIHYMPIEKNEIHQVFPFRNNRTRPLKFRVNLREYLSAYGVEIVEKSFNSKNSLSKKRETTRLVFELFRTGKYEMFSILNEIRENKLRDKKIDSSRAGIYERIRKLAESGFEFEDPNYVTRSETKYLTGDWFEEFLYPIFLETLEKTEQEIGMGVQLKKGNAPNEYDIMFTHNNSLYVVECKTDIADNQEGRISTLFTNTLYKAATLKKEFGLWVNYYLFALNDFSQLTPEQVDRAKLLGIKLVGLEILADRERLIDFVKKM